MSRSRPQETFGQLAFSSTASTWVRAARASRARRRGPRPRCSRTRRRSRRGADRRGRLRAGVRQSHRVRHRGALPVARDPGSRVPVAVPARERPADDVAEPETAEGVEPRPALVEAGREADRIGERSRRAGHGARGSRRRRRGVPTATAARASRARPDAPTRAEARRTAASRSRGTSRSASGSHGPSGAYATRHARRPRGATDRRVRAARRLRPVVGPPSSVYFDKFRFLTDPEPLKDAARGRRAAPGGISHLAAPEGRPPCSSRPSRSRPDCRSRWCARSRRPTGRCRRSRARRRPAPSSP